MKRPGPPVSRRTFVALAGASAVAGCLGAPDEDETPTPEVVQDDYTHPRPSENPDWDAPSTSPRVDIEVETLVENLEIPWDIAFTGTGEMFLTERTGQVLRFDSGEVSEVTRPRDAIDAGSLEPGSDERPWWVDGGEGGTLGIEVHPDYPDETWVYVYYTAEISGGKENRVVRFDVDAANPSNTEEILVDGIPADSIHNGGRIRFGPDGNLWICCGDAGERQEAQDPSSLAGSILRVTPDGRIPSSNPDLKDRRVFTYGHRNPQGIDWLPSGVPIISEFGPTNRDEVNLLLPGGNYGWPKYRGGPEDPSEDFGKYTEASGDIVRPLVNTGPNGDWAPTGATFYTGEDLPAWQNRFVIGGLISQSIWVVTLTPPGEELPTLNGNAWRYDADWLHDAFTATAHEMLHDELGRVRHVAQSPSGELYAITSNRDGRATQPFPRENDDVLVRLTPA